MKISLIIELVVIFFVLIYIIRSTIKTRKIIKETREMIEETEKRIKIIDELTKKIKEKK